MDAKTATKAVLNAINDDAKFDVDEFTSNTQIIPNPDIANTYRVTGDGSFDKMMETCLKHLDALFMSNRIRQEDYATIFSELYKTNLEVAVIAGEKAANKALIKRQIQGYNESYKKDILKIMADSWSIGFSSSEDAFIDESSGMVIPDVMRSVEINAVYQSCKDDLDEGIAYTRAETLGE